MNNLALAKPEEMGAVDAPKPLLAYSRDSDPDEQKAQLIESIVDYLLANGSMPA